MLAAGQLKYRIALQQRGTVQDAIGQPVEVWVTLATVWGSIRYPSGLSAIKSSADVSTAQASIRIRYRDGLDAGLRVIVDGQAYGIDALLPNRSEGYIDLVCKRAS